jgi:WD40 repeat protein
VRIWEVATLREVQCYRGHTDHVVAAVFTKDSQSVISGGTDRTLHHWDVATGSLRRKLEGHRGRIGALSRSPNGDYLVSSCGVDVRVWTIDTGKEIFKSSISGFGKFSADGNSLLIASDGATIRKVSLQGVVEAELQKLSGAIHTAAVTAAWPHFVATGDDPGHVQFWDIRGHFVQNVGKHPSRVWSVRFSPDGQRLASGSRDGTICIWDARPRPALHRHSLLAPQAVYSATLTGDGKQLYVGNRDNRIRCWDVASGQVIYSRKVPVEAPWGLTLLPDQHTLAFMGWRPGTHDGFTGLFDLESGRVDYLSSRAGEWLAVSPNAKYLAAHQWTTRRAEPGDEVLASDVILFCPPARRTPAVVATNHHAVAFHPNGKFLAVGGRFTPTLLYDCDAGKVLAQTLDGAFVTAITFSRDGTLMAIGTGQGSVRLLDGTTLEEKANLDISAHIQVTALTFSPDGRTLAGASNDGVVRLWNLVTGRVVLTYSVSNKRISALFFTPDNRTLIFGTVNHTTEEGELVFLYGTGAAAE